MARTSNKYRNKKRQNASLYGPLGSKPVAAKAAPHYHKRHSHPNHHHNTHQHPVRAKRQHYSSGRDTRIPVQQVKFSLRLPPLNSRKTSTEYNDMPWYPTTTSTNHEYDYTEKSSVKILQHLSASGLQRLDEELLSFAAYVRLTPTECEARDYVIQHIADTCQRLFSSRNVQIQAFGSYATKQVCTFASDVDLALWGVVPTNEETGGTHTRFSNNDNDLEEEDQKPAAVESINGKEDRVQKWKEALAELDAQEKSDDDIVTQGKQQVTDFDKLMAPVDSSECADGKGDTVPLNDDLSETPTVSEQEVAAAATACAPRDAAASATTSEDTNIEQVGLTSSSTGESLGLSQQPEEENSLFVIDRVGDEIVVQEQEIQLQQLKPEPESESDKHQMPQENPAAQATEADKANVDSSNDLPEGDGSRNAPLDVDTMADGSAAAPLEIDESDSDADSADKLEAYGRRVASTNNRKDHDESDSKEEEEGPFVSLSDSENDDLEVSFVSHASKESVSPPSVGPQGETRKLVLGALKSLGRQLWKSPIIHTVEVRKHARVPIIATGTHLGFEGDIALGGHNGTDTSEYASSQAQRFKR